ncbi:hypothetical protein [Salisediminibacterium beveridgei]|uniref:Uncharacterized protein n=1 Tax=Salisediminibacterium beveridgei TaxID=632773 RepID=A0A1D7QZM6_9BACI|nr:hypothetical protein [Salisediminibacterium beveridgei]AOM84459.1 hypothetical protein BBEV_3143 [Salisediminibacterium beveridgei]
MLDVVIVMGIFVVLLVLAGQMLKQKENAKAYHQEIKELKEMISQADRKKEERFESWIQASSEEMYRIMGEHYLGLSQKVYAEWEENLSTMKAQVKNFVNERQIEHDRWVQRISDEDLSTQQKLEMLETAMNQFPESRELHEAYDQTLQPYLKDSSKEIRMRTARKLNQASRTLLDYCSIDEWDYAVKRYNENLRTGNLLMKSHVEEKLASERKKLDQLESAVTRLSREPDNQSLIDEIETIEGSLDQKTIERDPVLLKRLREITGDIVGHFTRGNENEEHQVKDYNKRAITSFREASVTFRNNEKTFKGGSGLVSLTEKMGGWDMNVLHPEVQAYYQAVYQEIFGKLDPEVKPKFTERMLNTQDKVV